MNRRQNAEQMLGVAPNASPEEISNAFQAKVSELTQKKLPSGEFQNQLNQLYAAHDLLRKSERELSLFNMPFDTPFGSFGYIDNYMRQMQREMNQLFEQHHYPSNMHNQLTQMEQSQQAQNPQDPHNLQTYRYARSFNKSIKVDKDGNVVGSSNKTIQNNDKVFREEKQFDSSTNKIRVKRYKPDGTVKEFEKPYHNKYMNRLLN